MTFVVNDSYSLNLLEGPTQGVDHGDGGDGHQYIEIRFRDLPIPGCNVDSSSGDFNVEDFSTLTGHESFDPLHGRRQRRERLVQFLFNNGATEDNPCREPFVSGNLGLDCAAAMWKTVYLIQVETTVLRFDDHRSRIDIQESLCRLFSRDRVSEITTVQKNDIGIANLIADNGNRSGQGRETHRVDHDEHSPQLELLAQSRSIQLFAQCFYSCDAGGFDQDFIELGVFDQCQETPLKVEGEAATHATVAEYQHVVISVFDQGCIDRHLAEVVHDDSHPLIALRAL